MVEKLLEHFMKKNYKRLINKNLEKKKLEKVIKKKGDKLMSNGKVMIVYLLAGLIKNTYSNKFDSIDWNSIV